MDETRVENLYLGHATAYGYAKAKGYEGTEEEFAQLCADLGIDIEQLENMTVIINMLEPDADPSGTYSDGVLTLNLPRGVKGDTGESAYEYAVAGGYTGTEEEFQQLCADLGIEVDHLENMTVVVNMVAPSVQPSATYVDGTLTINIQSATAEQVSTATDAWLAQNITNPSNPPLDRSLTLANAATPADITGELKSAFTNGIKDITEGEIITGWTIGGYASGSTATTIDVNSPNTGYTNYFCTYRQCQEGDVFYISSKGASALRNAVFLSSADGENNILLKTPSENNYVLTDYKFTAPPNATYVVFNAHNSVPFCVVKSETLLKDRVSALEVTTGKNETDIAAIDNIISALFDNKTATVTGEMLEEFSQITDASITGATSAVIRNAQIFEAKYPGTSGQYGVAVTKNSDGSYTFDGLATSGAWFFLNQTTRTGTDNVVTLNGTYAFRGRIVSGSWQNISYEGSTSGIISVLKAADSSQLVSCAIGVTEEKTFEVDSDTNVVIGFRLTNGVRYNNLRIEISLNEGDKLFPTVPYLAPTTISDFGNVASVAQNYTPYLWIQTTPATASISVSGKILKSDESGGDGINLYGILEKNNDRVDILTQMFTKPLFLVYTDIHGDAENLKRIETWHNNNKPTYVSDIYCLGDMVDDQASDPITQFEDTTIWAKTLRVIGNHDVLVSTIIPGITAVAAYEKYIAPAVANWGVTQPDDAATEGKNYYYKDYSNKIRVIVLDTYFYTTTEHEWFVEILADAAANNLAVIVAEHEDICTGAEKQPLNADYPFAKKHDGYTNLAYRTYGDGGNYQTKRDAVDAFIGNGGTFICWLVGHQHADMTGTYNGGTNGKQLSVNLSNASKSTISSTRINGYSQDCFTYVGVDTDANYIYLLRIGEAVDKWFHQNLFLCYDYVNHTVVEYH